jgi:AcrR family transcriptional regulator
MTRKSEQSTQTRETLLDNAERLFASSGYDAASVAAICSAAGVSKGAFYHHFSSKQALFFELMRRWLENLEGRLTQIENQSDQVSAKLFSMAHVVGEVIEVGGPQLSIYLEFWNQALRDREVHTALSKPFDDFLIFFSELLRSGMERGTIRASDAEMTARVVTAMAIGLLFQGLLDPDAVDWNDVTKFGLDILLKGLDSEAMG